MSNFSFLHNVFKSRQVQMHLNVSAGWKGLKCFQFCIKIYYFYNHFNKIFVYVIFQETLWSYMRRFPEAFYLKRFPEAK